MKPAKPALIPGLPMQIGGREFVIAPLTLGQLRRLMPKVKQLAQVGANMSEAQIGTLVEIVTAAVQRNHPDVTVDTMENLLDLGNAGDVLTEVLSGAGLKLRGEVTATSPTGVASTDSSPQPAATATP